MLENFWRKSKMCLDTVTKRIKPTKQVRVGWKIFCISQRDDHKELQLTYYLLERRSIIKRGEWLKAEERPILFDFFNSNNKYPSGFHAYKEEPDLDLFYLCERHLFNVIKIKVKLRGVHTIGLEGTKEVLVAREMFVPKEK